MKRYLGKEFVPENNMEEYALLVGRVEAAIAYIKNNGYSLSDDALLAMLGYDEEE